MSSAFWGAFLVYISVIVLCLAATGVFTNKGENTSSAKKTTTLDQSRTRRDKGLLYLGAGVGRIKVLENYLFQGFSWGVFVEAHPANFSHLEKNLWSFNQKHQTEYSAVQALITGAPGQETEFFLYSQPDFSSVLLPDEKQWFWPEVKVLKNMVFTSVTVDKLGFDLNSFDKICLDLNGMDGRILPFLEPYLENLETLEIHNARSKNYQNSTPVSSVSLQQGFLTSRQNERGIVYKNSRWSAPARAVAKTKPFRDPLQARKELFDMYQYGKHNDHMLDLYRIPNTRNLTKQQLNSVLYTDPRNWPSFQQDLEHFKAKVVESVEKRESLSAIRVFDGEIHFLHGETIGNIGRRHLSKPMETVDLNRFKNGLYQNDIVTTLLPFYQSYRSLNLKRKIDIPGDIIYGLFASKWFFREFRNKRIAIMGSFKKLAVIQKLFAYRQFRNFVGLQGFSAYITVPEKFNCDDPDQLEQNIGSQLQKADFDICLYGIGIGKLAVAHTFSKYRPSVYIDVGSGITALAGMTNLGRPYYGSWVNFRLRDHDYGNTDQVDFASGSAVVLKRTEPKFFLFATNTNKNINSRLLSKQLKQHGYSQTFVSDQADLFVLALHEEPDLQNMDVENFQPGILYQNDSLQTTVSRFAWNAAVRCHHLPEKERNNAMKNTFVTVCHI